MWWLYFQGIKLESFPKCDFIPVDYYEVRHVKSSFKKLMRACVPSSVYTDKERGILKAVEETEWLPQVTFISDHHFRSIFFVTPLLYIRKYCQSFVNQRKAVIGVQNYCKINLLFVDNSKLSFMSADLGRGVLHQIYRTRFQHAKKKLDPIGYKVLWKSGIKKI